METNKARYPLCCISAMYGESKHQSDCVEGKLSEAIRERDALKAENENLKKDFEKAVGLLRESNKGYIPGEMFEKIEQFIYRFPVKEDKK